MADAEVEAHAGFRITLDPDDYGQALDDALSALRAAHHIVVCAIEKRDLSFAVVEAYLHLLDVLQETCGCRGVLASAFFDEAVDSWEF
jgi:hypothetical protein